MVDLAERVKALVVRDDRLTNRTASIEDPAWKATPSRPKRVETEIRITSERTAR